jgi:TRAP-type C4-dicarboxylate transport system substrate-binding protein
LGLVALCAQPATAQVRWDLPCAYASTSFLTEGLVQFAADLERASAGALKITVHPNASLFKAPEIKRAVQNGQAQIGEILLVNFENEQPVYGLDGLPFLAAGYDEAWRLYQAQKPALQRLLEKQGMVLLYAVPWPPQGLFLKKPINSVADMRRVKWRAYSPSTARIAELIGAQPVTVQAAELSQALATGAVESYMSSGATAYDTKSYETLSYFYDVQAWLPKNAVIMNRRAFEALDKPVREAVLKVAADAERRGWQVSRAKNEYYKKALSERGMKVLPSPEKLSADLQQVGSIMLEDWLKKSGEEGKALIAAYRSQTGEAPR